MEDKKLVTDCLLQEVMFTAKTKIVGRMTASTTSFICPIL